VLLVVNISPLLERQLQLLERHVFHLEQLLCSPNLLSLAKLSRALVPSVLMHKQIQLLRITLNQALCSMFSKQLPSLLLVRLRLLPLHWQFQQQSLLFLSDRIESEFLVVELFFNNAFSSCFFF
jgi:hypothetical protein